MPDLGKYAFTVGASYAVSLALIAGLVALSVWRSRVVRRQLAEAEGKEGTPDMKWLMALPPLIFAGLVVAFLMGMRQGDPQSLPSVFLDKSAPALGQQALGDYPLLTDADLRGGQVTVVNFWASWCPPCRAEHPVLKQMAADGIRVAGVNMMDRAGDAQSYLTDDGNPFFAIGFDPRGATRIEWGVTAPPETFIIRGDGTVAYRFAGPLVGSDFDQRFLPQLQKALGRDYRPGQTVQP